MKIPLVLSMLMCVLPAHLPAAADPSSQGVLTKDPGDGDKYTATERLDLKMVKENGNFGYTDEEIKKFFDFPLVYKYDFSGLAKNRILPPPAPGGGSTTGTATTPTPPQPPITDVGTGFQPSRQQLRQEVARLFGENEGSRIVTVQIALTFDARNVEVSALPSFLRGSLSGPASFHGESALQFAGEFTKAQVEEMVERLPDFTPGSCRVKLGVQANAG